MAAARRGGTLFVRTEDVRHASNRRDAARMGVRRRKAGGRADHIGCIVNLIRWLELSIAPRC
jgi:hypothetical protein